MDSYQLPNGIRVVSERIPYTRSICFGIWVRAGSRNEQPRQSGISHFIEHMFFKGTSLYSMLDIANLFDESGGEINAFTTKEYTCYHFYVLDEFFQRAIEMIAELFHHPAFDEGEMEKEKKVIIEEIAMCDDTPDELVFDLIEEVTFPGHPLGSPILGTEHSLMALTADDLRAYMKRHYSNDRIVLSVTGNFVDSLHELLSLHFSAYENSTAASEPVKPNFSHQLITRIKPIEQNHLCLAVEGLPNRHPDFIALRMLNMIVGDGMSSRLFQEIREQRGLAYSVYSSLNSYSDSGLFSIYAATSPEQTTELLEVTFSVLAELIERGVSDRELQRTKQQLRGDLILSLEGPNSRMMHIGRTELMHDRHLTNDQLLQKISEVTTEQIHQLARRLLCQPWAAALVGCDDQAIQKFRRDQLVLRS